MKVKEIINLLELSFPLVDACDWDYTGWQIKANNLNLSVSSIMLSLDISNELVQDAIKNNVNLVICHHPFFFESELNELKNNNWKYEAYKTLVENNINVYVMHTNFDRNINGMNISIAKDLKFNDIDFFNNEKLAVIGKYNNIDLATIYNNIKKYFALEKLEVITNNLKSRINEIVLAAGAGGFIIHELANYSLINESNILFITGEMKWHQRIEAIDKNINVAVVGHNMEEKFVDFVTIFLNSHVKIKEKIRIKKFLTKKSFFI